MRHLRRLEGGLGCTMDVLDSDGIPVVLRRYGPWYAERGEDAAARETRALRLLASAGVRVPEVVWLDDVGVFAEQAIVTTFVDGAPDLDPADPASWAVQLADELVRIHAVGLSEDDRTVFLPGKGEDDRRVTDGLGVVSRHPLGAELLERRRLLEREVSPVTVFSHTDYWPGNTMWQDGTLAAVVDWEAPAVSGRGMDVAYCALDITYLGMPEVAQIFVEGYRRASGDRLDDLAYWEAVGLCRPFPDIADWTPAWSVMGSDVDVDTARRRHTAAIADLLRRTA